MTSPGDVFPAMQGDSGFNLEAHLIQHAMMRCSDRPLSSYRPLDRELGRAVARANAADGSLDVMAMPF
jgi:hypothetical protein